MSLPYFPMYPTDFEADTSHLTLAEDGAYNRLLRLMWMTPGCTLPADNAWIKRRMRCDQKTFDEVVKVVIDEFFTVKNGRLSNAKLCRIFTETNAAHEKRVLAGSKGGKAKALKTNKTAPSNAQAMPKQPEPEPEPYIEKDTNVSQKGEPFDVQPKPPPKSFLPENWKPDQSDFEYAISQHLTPKEITELSDEFSTYWSELRTAKGKKSQRGWAQCWRGHVRRNAATYIRNRRMAGQSVSGGHGQGGSIASIVARRHAGG